MVFASNQDGYRICDFSGPVLAIQDEILNHIFERLGPKYIGNSKSFQQLAVENHECFKNKIDRTLDKKAVERLAPTLQAWFGINGIGTEFITDEESLGYANIYFRVVRPFKEDDVGGVHADRWFWETGASIFPTGFQRIKLWAPLLQNDSEPSLTLLPGSHLKQFIYQTKRGADGKLRPFLDPSDASAKLIPAPVKVGQCVIFHDSLLHQGRATNSPRISVEFTMALRES